MTVKIAKHFSFAPEPPWPGFRADVEKMLRLVEVRFGRTHGDRTLVAVIADGHQDCHVSEKLDIVIRVQNWNAGDPRQAHFQVSHETLHALSQIPEVRRTNLEEGLATVFQQDYDVCCYGSPPLQPPPNSDYELARNDVRELLNLDPNVIRKIRMVEPTISRITAVHIRDACASCSEELADRLARPFDS